MNNTLLFELVSALTLRERQEAEKWLRSPVHNEREDILRLFVFLQEQLFYLQLLPDREQVFRHLYPDKAFDDQPLRLVCSYLLQCLEEWLSWRQWQHQNKGKGIHLLEDYRTRGLDKHFVRQERKQRALLNKQPIRNHQFHFSSYQLEQELYLYQSRQGRGQALNFQAQEKALQLAFMSYKLRLACLSTAHQRVSGANYAVALLPEILALSQQEPYCHEPAVAIYYHVYQMYQEADSAAAFRQFEQLLLAHVSSFPTHEARDLVLLGINFCIRQINKKGNAYFKEALDLYRQGLANDLLLEDGYLSAFTYSNIVMIAIKSGELDWVAHFIEHYRTQLEPRRREGIYALNAARLAYHQGNHRQALLLLHQFSDRDFIHTLSAKIIQLKIYYEAGDYQLLSSHIRNTRAYLRRITQDSYHKQIYVNIFSLTDQLLKLPPYDTAKRKALRQQIESTEPLTEKEWLLAQLG